MLVEIDTDSGFCFGVVNAIKHAEKVLKNEKLLYCLGDIVHNSQEVKRLELKGLQTITHDKLTNLKNTKVLLRAHGEPPEIYRIAKENMIDIIDATCPVVLQLQKKIYKEFTSGIQGNSQIVIYGKMGHAEVNGLVGQTSGQAVVIENLQDLNKLDFTKNISLFSQTTMSLDNFHAIIEYIKNHISPTVTFKYFDTICRQVANRMPNIKKFAARHDLILFVAGKKSSNGRVLYEECKKANPNTFLISDCCEIRVEWLTGIESVGVCGATSTPKWLMENIALKIKEIAGNLTKD